MKIPTPYIGITDFTNVEQVIQLQQALEEEGGHELPNILHVGVMMGHNTLRNLPLVKDWERTVTPKENIRFIFVSQDTQNCIHFADYVGRPDLSESLCKAMFFGGMFTNAIQLDMVFPDRHEIEKFLKLFKTIEIILQINSPSMESVDNNPDKLLKKLDPYQGLVHRVLLDKSMGGGIPLVPSELLPYTRAIRKHFPQMGIGVAGKLGPDNLELLEPFLDEDPTISQDSQSGARRSGNARDSVDWDIAEEIVRKSVALRKRFARQN